jgi:hypothetical protein
MSPVARAQKRDELCDLLVMGGAQPLGWGLGSAPWTPGDLSLYLDPRKIELMP